MPNATFGRYTHSSLSKPPATHLENAVQQLTGFFVVIHTSPDRSTQRNPQGVDGLQSIYWGGQFRPLKDSKGVCLYRRQTPRRYAPYMPHIPYMYMRYGHLLAGL